MQIDQLDLADSGEYKAVLTNSFGECETKCRLNVFDLDSKKNVAPTFVEELKSNVQVNEGQDVCLRCRVDGTPPIQLKWFRDDVLLTENDKVKVSSLLTNTRHLVSI